MLNRIIESTSVRRNRSLIAAMQLSTKITLAKLRVTEIKRERC